MVWSRWAREACLAVGILLSSHSFRDLLTFLICAWSSLDPGLSLDSLNMSYSVRNLFRGGSFL